MLYYKVNPKIQWNSKFNKNLIKKIIDSKKQNFSIVIMIYMKQTWKKNN